MNDSSEPTEEPPQPDEPARADDPEAAPKVEEPSGEPWAKASSGDKENI